MRGRESIGKRERASEKAGQAGKRKRKTSSGDFKFHNILFTNTNELCVKTLT